MQFNCAKVKILKAKGKIKERQARIDPTKFAKISLARQLKSVFCGPKSSISIHHDYWSSQGN